MSVGSKALLEDPSLLQRYGGQMRRSLDRSQADLALSRGLKLRRMDSLMRNIVSSSFDGIITFNEAGRIETANPAALKAFGYDLDEVFDKSLFDIIPEIGGDDEDVATLLRLGRGQREMRGLHKDGTGFPLELTIGETTGDCGERLFVAIVRDITERKEQERQLEHQALHDALTNLPNRSLLHDRLGHALEMAARTEQPMALLLIDLDRFKEVNDTLGHHVGDLVLIEVSERLKSAVRNSDTIARLGGDEFAILLPAVSDVVRARRVAERVTKALEARFQVIEGIELEVGCSIGIALYPDHSDDGVKLMQCADVAMYTAKRGQLGISLYDEGKDTHSVRHLTLTGELRQAIENGDLSLHYQPKIDLKTRKLTSVEALARWIHPVHGYIPPDEFVLTAERTGLIELLTRWAFQTSFRQLRHWNQTGLDISIAINLSARALHDESLPQIVSTMIRDHGLDPVKLILEITESAIMIDPDRALAVVSRLADLGLRLSIDDFGTGYSSLAYLRHLPVQELKIDKSFVCEMDGNQGDMVIVRSTVDLAHNLGLSVVAEGIERMSQVELLGELGCDRGQGYFISPPLTADEFDRWTVTSPFGVKPSGNPLAATG